MSETSVCLNRSMHSKAFMRSWGMLLSALQLKGIGCENMNDDYILLVKAAVTSATWVPRRLTTGIDRAGITCSSEGELCYLSLTYELT